MSANLRSRIGFGAGVAALALLASVLAAPAASAVVPWSCPSYDDRTATDKMPQPGVVIVEEYSWGPSSSTFLLDGDGRLSSAGWQDGVRFVSVWGNGTSCTGQDFTRNTWAVTPDGAVWTNNSWSGSPPANYYGDASDLPLNQPIVGMSPTSTGKGYWLVASDGGIFTYGDAKFYGSTGAMRLNKPIVGMSVTPTGKGYWLVATDGGIFTFGDARFYGSTGNIVLNKPVTGMTATPSGRGYWMVASDGGVFTFGDAAFKGSTGGYSPAPQIVGMIPWGKGYMLIGQDASLYPFP